MQLIDGKSLATKVQQNVAEEVEQLKQEKKYRSWFGSDPCG